MRSLLERTLLLASPLLFAAATSKKPDKTKRAPRVAPTRKSAPTKKTRAAPKREAPKAESKVKGRAAKPERRGAAPTKSQPPPPTKNELAQTKAVEPAVKPPAPTGRPLLLTPENGKYSDSVYPKFRWLSVGGANRYDVMWSEHPDLTDAESITSIATEAAVPVETPLRVGATYYWRVRGGNAGGWGPWSALSSFQVLEGPPPS